MTSVLTRGEETHRHTRRRHVKVEAGTGAMRPQPTYITDGQQPPEAGSSRKDAESLRGAWPCPHLDLGLAASRAGREYISVVLCHDAC